MKFFLYILLIIGTIPAVLAQNRLNIERAGFIESGKEDGRRYTKLSGNVIITQNDLRVYCDVAYQYKKSNQIEAFGNVIIRHGDSITITGDKLLYRGDIKVAQMRQNVVFKNKVITLYTNFLDFDRKTQLAYYFKKGKVIDSTNVITSGKGYYQTRSKVMSFKKDVVLTNPDYVLNSDTLVYNTISKIAYFVAPTELVDKNGDIINYNEGQYNTVIKLSNLIQGQIETDDYILKYDFLRSDDLAGYFKAVNNVEIFGKADSVIITGQIAEHWRRKGMTKIYGDPVLKKIMQGDTLYISSDTIVSLEYADKSQNRILAYHDVRIFKNDLQGLADSAAYLSQDSVMFFYRDPILWMNDDTQVVADTIDIEIANGEIDKMNMNSKAFVIIQDSLEYFNQVKGRNMETHFIKSQISKVDVEGNGESIYFVINEEEKRLVGLNRILCSSMLIKFVNQKVNDITFYTNPDATFIPPHEIEDPDTRLKSFKWRKDEKPSLEDVIYRNSEKHEGQKNLPPQVQISGTPVTQPNSGAIKPKKELEKKQE